MKQRINRHRVLPLGLCLIAGLSFFLTAWQATPGSNQHGPDISGTAGNTSKPVQESQSTPVVQVAAETDSAETLLFPAHPSRSRTVTMCHKPEGQRPVTIRIPESAAESHLAHGDANGPCPVDPEQDTSEAEGVEASRGKLYSELESARIMLDYSEQVLEVAILRLNRARKKLDDAILDASLDEHIIRESRAVLAEAETDVEALTEAVEKARADIQHVAGVAEGIYR